MGRKRFPLDRGKQRRSKALGFGNCSSVVSACSGSFLSLNLQLRHPKPGGDLGGGGQPSTAKPPFQQLLPALPCLGTGLRAAWEPPRGFHLPTQGFRSEEGWQEGYATAQRGAGDLSPLTGAGGTEFVTEVMVGAAYATTGL